jgi:hypothetical protein
MGFNFRLTSSLDSCTGAEIKMMGDGTVGLRLLKLSLDKKLINIISKNNEESKLENLGANLSGPVAITVTGRGVLIKKTKRAEELTNAVIQALFPGLKFTDFYVQNFVSEECSFVSLIRKETLDQVLSALNNNACQVLNVSIGPFVIDHVIPQLNVYNDSLVFDGNSISLNRNRSWNDYMPNVLNESEFEFKLDIEVIEEQFLLAYASAFQLILNHSLVPIQIEVDEVKLIKADFYAKLVFEKRVTIVAALLFLSLLFNFFLFHYYNSENQNFTGMVGQRSEVLVNRKKVQSDINEKERLVEKLGWNNGLSYAFICDQIGEIVPSSVTLTEVSINSNSLKDIAQTQLGTRQVKIGGQAQDVYALNRFIYAFKNRKWVKQVKLQRFIFDEQKQTQLFNIIVDY